MDINNAIIAGQLRLAQHVSVANLIRIMYDICQGHHCDKKAPPYPLRAELYHRIQKGLFIEDFHKRFVNNE